MARLASKGTAPPAPRSAANPPFSGPCPRLAEAEQIRTIPRTTTPAARDKYRARCAPPARAGLLSGMSRPSGRKDHPTVVSYRGGEFEARAERLGTQRG